MPTAILLHGTGGSPEKFWFPAISAHLTDAGYDVWVPQLPDADTPRLDLWLPFVQAGEGRAYQELGDDTVLIGHSAGCPLVLSVLQHADVQVAQAICVAGFYTPLAPEIDGILQSDYDWDAIKAGATEIVLINSDDDPWGCTAERARPVADALGARLITATSQGHMGSERFGQPYREFPLLEQELSINRR